MTWQQHLSALRILRPSVLAHILGVSDRTVRRWRDGTDTPTEEHQGELRRLYEARVRDVAREVASE